MNTSEYRIKDCQRPECNTEELKNLTHCSYSECHNCEPVTRHCRFCQKEYCLIHIPNHETCNLCTLEITCSKLKRLLKQAREIDLTHTGIIQKNKRECCDHLKKRTFHCAVLNCHEVNYNIIMCSGCKVEYCNEHFNFGNHSKACTFYNPNVEMLQLAVCTNETCKDNIQMVGLSMHCMIEGCHQASDLRKCFVCWATICSTHEVRFDSWMMCSSCAFSICAKTKTVLVGSLSQLIPI